MAFENLDLSNNEEMPPDESGAPPEESGNRTFLIIAGVLGAVALLCLVFIAIYALVVVPRSRSAVATQRAVVDSQNTQVAVIIESTSTSAAGTALAASFTATPTITPIPPTPTATASPTPLLAVATTEVPLQATATSTVSAQMQAAQVTLNANATLVYVSTQTARVLQQATQQANMPRTGFADSVGLPLMVGMAFVLIAVIFLARRLRSA